MANPRITFIGAGSSVFMKNIVGDILQREALAGAEIRLMDINPQRLEESEIIATKLVNTLGVPATVTTYSNQREALDGTNFVVVCFQIGGYEPSTVLDFEIPKKYNLRQTIADTLGIGGIMRGIRTVPHLWSICEDNRRVRLEGLCPALRLGRQQVKEHNRTEEVFNSPRHAYTKHLLASEPKGRAKPFESDAPIVLEGKRVKVAFTLKRGGFLNPDFFELVAVDNLDLKLQKHETLGLVGESGSGKTTFGQALIRLISNQGGEIFFDGQPIHTKDRKEMRPLRSRMQIVFQDPYASLNPRMSVRQIIEEGLIVNNIGANTNERVERVRQALRDAGMPDTILNRFPHEFSGGQRQRLAIARAIALEPEFILLDEPTSALDLSVQAQIIELLRKLQAEKGLSYLFISHDLKVVRALCHRVMVMQFGKVVEQGTVEEVLENPKTEYTSRLVRAAFDIAA